MLSLSIRSAIRSMPARASRSARSAGWMSLGTPASIEQQLGRHFEEAERALAQLVRVDAKIGDVVHREAEAALGKRGQGFVLDRAEIADRGLPELEHQVWRERAVGVHEIDELLEINGSFSVAADIAEQPDLAVLQLQAPHHLHAAEQQQIVDLRHQAGGFGILDEIGGRNDVAGFGPQPRHRLVEAHLALRQRHNRLQVKIDPAGIDCAGNQLLDALAGQPGEPARHVCVIRRRRCRRSRLRRGGGNSRLRNRDGLGAGATPPLSVAIRR